MGKTLDVIVVDDKKMITDLFESYINISCSNVIVHSFNDSVDALNFIISKGNNIDVVITDYYMPPGVNGLELLKATSSETSKIMISGWITDIAEEQLSDLNAVFFAKPVPMKQIGKIINDRRAF